MFEVTEAPFVVRKNDAKNFMEGEERCKQYYKTSQLLFGTSTLAPGTRGAVDPGHRNGHEIFYVARGQVVCRFPRINRSDKLSEGDIVVIPPGEPHELANESSDEALVCWSLAPPD